MRSMEYAPKDGREVELHTRTRLGQQPHESPDVFNYYAWDHSPRGPLGDQNLVSPESELGSAPYLLGGLNGIDSLIRHGLTSCDGGFGTRWVSRRGCRRWRDDFAERADGNLSYVPDAGAAAADIVADLSLLLTGGRLHARAAAVVKAAYAAALEEEGDPHKALKAALRRIVLAPEFHSTAFHTGTALGASAPRAPPALASHVDASKRRPYRAVVVLFMRGHLCPSISPPPLPPPPPPPYPTGRLPPCRLLPSYPPAPS